jgi:hypothetical protein
VGGGGGGGGGMEMFGLVKAEDLLFSQGLQSVHAVALDHMLQVRI